jgi:glucose-6-phosphate isomerase
MKLDASAHAGFRLLLDPDTLDVQTDGTLVFRRTSRTVGDLRNVLRSPDPSAPEREMYSMYYPTPGVGAGQPLLDRCQLTYSLVLVPPLTVDGEFAKTQGHYHPPVPGTVYGYPEVYTQLHGRLLLLLQQRDRARPATPRDCALIEMTPGVSVMVPPDYAHVLVNPTGELALMAGLYSPAFRPEYDEIYAQRGLAYYLVDQGGPVAVEANPRYVNPPPLRQPRSLTGTIFESPHPGRALWEAFTADPDAYCFLTDAEALKATFHLS